MANQHPGPDVWVQISVRRAQLLGRLSHGRTLRQTADDMGVSVSGTRSQAERLKAVARCETVRELAEWWREVRRDYVTYVAEASGVALGQDPEAA